MLLVLTVPFWMVIVAFCLGVFVGVTAIGLLIAAKGV